MCIISRTLPFAVMATGLLLSSGVLAQNTGDQPPAGAMPAQPPAAGTETPGAVPSQGAMPSQGTMGTTHKMTHHTHHVRHHAPSTAGTASTSGGAMSSTPPGGGAPMAPGGGAPMTPAAPGTEKQ